MEVLCDYCGNAAELVSGAEVYPEHPHLRGKWIWRCVPCGARVGCHPGTKTPLGRLADAALRRAKMEAHEAFDPLWKGGALKRRAAYAWLAEALGVPAERCHIGMMDLETCRRVVEVCRSRPPGRPT